jgi:hypothetical protein
MERYEVAGHMSEHPEGEWVWIKDHEAEIARLWGVIRRLHDSIEMLESLPGNEEAARLRHILETVHRYVSVDALVRLAEMEAPEVDHD